MEWYKISSEKKIYKLSNLSRSKDVDYEVLDTISIVENNLIKNKILNKNILAYFVDYLIPKKGDPSNLNKIKLSSLNKIYPLLDKKNMQSAEYWISNNEKVLDDIYNSLGKYALKSISSQDNKVNIEDYDIFIFDADKTILEGELAMNMVPPFVKLDENILKDSEGKVIKLKEGVRESFIKLKALGKDLGIISHSEKEGIPHEEQPLLNVLKKFDILNFFNEMIVILSNYPKSMFIPKEGRVLFIDDRIDNLIDVLSHTNADVIDADKIEYSKELDNKQAKREYIPVKDRPEKPKDGKEYELDHKKPRWNGGSDKKDNLQWVEKNKHKNKSSNEGSFEYGGKDRHKKLKDKGEKSYKDYQKGCGEEKIKQEREEIGEEAFSRKQRERAKKRWSYSDNDLKKESNILMFLSDIENNPIFSKGIEKIKDCGYDILQYFAEEEDRLSSEVGHDIARDKIISLFNEILQTKEDVNNDNSCFNIKKMIRKHLSLDKD